MSDLLGGGNIHLHRNAVQPGKTGITYAQAVTVAVTAAIGVALLVCLLVAQAAAMTANTPPSLTGAISDTIRQINDTAAQNISPTDAIDNAQKQADANPAVHITITPGSCGSHTPDDYTITASDKSNQLVIYASTIGTFATGTTATKTATQTAACKG